MLFLLRPPPDRIASFDVPLAHKIYKFYKKIYLLLEIIDLTVTSALQNKNAKLPTLNSARIKIEVMKRLIRLVGELGIIKNEKYLELESNLQEISKDTNNWMRSLISKSDGKEIPN
ncbi:MAG: hypothetical protein ACD_15C00077G0005 [uncultured bacterium]|nr:MAG: hypothetical protein ACD_15C00077G0005 [uncultured bacterium]